ncbi:DMT family transporter [Pelagibacterium montanilacus]|uniref:DMT family transporter n=1 Tax=Pelagibacterium montanilacus TaxID=2185280 RepID=UPI000F8D3D08|nr:DMT family transporter [Pelagibacterium montanilacus]
MAPISSNLRGIILMVAASGAFVVNDSLFKLGSQGLPVFQAIAMRGVMAMVWCLPLLVYTRTLARLPMVIDRWALLRNGFEILTVFCFLSALTRMPIADITAIGQLSPVFVLIGAAVIFREALGRVQIGLILAAFFGALLVAQPTGEAFSPFAILGVFAAIGMAGRDLAARKLPAEMPGPVVTYGALLMVMLAAGLVSLIFEEWTTPTGRSLAFLAGSGFFLMFGQLFIYLTYRIAATNVVAPFFFTGSLWAVVLGASIFGEIPGPVAIIGIVLVAGSGAVLVMRTRRAARIRAAMETK